MLLALDILSELPIDRCRDGPSCVVLEVQVRSNLIPRPMAKDRLFRNPPLHPEHGIFPHPSHVGRCSLQLGFLAHSGPLGCRRCWIDHILDL